MLTNQKLTDDQLVAAYVKGDNKAFDTLLNRHQASVYSYIMHLVKDADLANDLFQETFVKAIVTLQQSRYKSDGKFAAWLSRIAHNLVIDYFRQDNAVSLVSTDNDDINILNRKDLSEGSVEDLIVDEQMLKDILNLLTSLSPDQRAVVEMRYFENLSFKEIAERTGVSINTALGRMRYAILNMRRRAKEADLIIC